MGIHTHKVEESLPYSAVRFLLQYYTVDRSVKAHEDKCNRALPERYAKITMRHSEAAAELSNIEQEFQAQVR